MFYAAFVCLVFSLISWSTALSSGDSVSIRPPKTSYKWQSYTFSPIPSLLKRQVNQKILGCLLWLREVYNGRLLPSFNEDRSFFCYTTSQASTWTVCWKPCFLKSLSAHAQCSFTSVRVYVCVCFCFTELLGSPLKEHQSNNTFLFPSLPGRGCCSTANTRTHAMNKIYTVCTDWSSQLL